MAPSGHWERGTQSSSRPVATPYDPRCAGPACSPPVDQPGGNQRPAGAQAAGRDRRRACRAARWRRRCTPSAPRRSTLLVRGDRLLPRTEPFAGEMVAESFRERRASTCVSVVPRPVSSARCPDGPVTVHIDDGSRIEADEILVATGRRRGRGRHRAGDGRPGAATARSRSTRACGRRAYPAAGSTPSATSTGATCLTHMGKYQARVCGDVIAARAAGQPDDLPALRDTADDRGAPQVIFTDPQVCTVGRTEATGSRRRLPGTRRRVRHGPVDPGASCRPTATPAGRRWSSTRTAACSWASPSPVPRWWTCSTSATVAVTAEVPLDRLWHAVPAFPTVSEIWLCLLEEYAP